MTRIVGTFRCQVGDLSGRHGKISVGSKAYVYNDVNLPLSGDWYTSAIGKFIPIHFTTYIAMTILTLSFLL